MKKLLKSLKIAMGASLYSMMLCQSAFAEDTEIFFAPVSDTDNIIPNIMFVMDTSGSMNRYPSGESQTRIQIMKDVMTDVLNQVSNVNVGLMRYNKGDTSGVNSAEGGPVLYPATYIDAPSDPVVSQFITQGDDDASESADTGEVIVTLNAQNLPIAGSGTTYVGLRFDQLLVPQGAEIVSANLVFSANGNSSDASNIAIYGELSSDAAPFTATANNISNRLLNATAPVTWTPASWTDGDSYASEDLTSVVQSIVDQSGWCGGNAMAFIMSGTGLRSAYSVEGSVANSIDPNYFPAPKIKIKFKNKLPASANGCTQIDVVTSVANKRHDWEYFSNGSTSYSSTDLDFYYGNNGSPTKGVGISFQNVNIPANAIIKSATISIVPRSSTNNAGEIDIYGVNDGNPNPTKYSTLRGNASLGPVNWPLGKWSTNVTVDTPDITSLVQAIVNRGDWALGNTMSFYLVGKSGYHRGRSYDDGASNAPRLKIFYEATYEEGVLTKREELKQVVADLPASGYTPISDTMAEAGLYYRGDKVTYGLDRDHVSSNRTSHIDSFDATGSFDRPAGCTEDNLGASACAEEKIVGNPNYVSPITDSCQTSHIVFLTDGAPTSHHSITNDVYKDWTGGSTCSGNSYGKDCAIKIAGFLHNNDQNANLAGLQTVTTHTIGFDINLQFLQDMADAGGGQYYTASTKDQLVSAITSIVSSIVDVNTSFVSAGVSVNQLNRLTHNDQLYYALFSPDSTNVWPGNVKRYRLSGSTILDANGASAVDPVTNEFNKTAKSFWGNVVDGADTEKGGAAEQLTTSRNVYTFLGDKDLTASSNRVSEANSLITQSMLGAVDSSDREVILKWANGIDTNNLPSITAHHIMGDPLHSQPTIIAYNTGSASSPTYLSKVLVGTNHGYLHQIDADSGKEDWAFIPQELLPLLSPIQKKSGGPHTYGMDGSISIYMSDENGNFAIDSGEKAYLFVGQRRGGNSYFAIDISTPNQPKFMYQINPSVSGYSKLGQTWSKPIAARMNINGEANKLVLIFGGGYDTAQDLAGTSPISDSLGNIVYIADAATGALLWDSANDAIQAPTPAGSLTLMNAVPSPVSAFDIDNDGLIDHIYVADTKAQVFRFDVDNNAQKITGGRIAHLNDNSVADNRRFYYSPDVAFIRLIKDSFISVSIGSGYRSHPLNTQIDDHFFMLKDRGALNNSFDMDLSINDLADVTSLIGDANGDGKSDAQAQIESTGDNGWYISFADSGEKVIENSVTFNNTVLFNTYIPPGSSSSTVCQAQAGNSRFYAMKIIDGNPYVDTNYDGVLDQSDRTMELTGPGIAPAPQIITQELPDGKVDRVVCMGTQCLGSGGVGPFLRPPPDGLVGVKWLRN